MVIEPPRALKITDPPVPAGPVGPDGPEGPDTPVAPVEPVAPCGPLVPASPFAPVRPFGPVAPLGPVAFQLTDISRGAHFFTFAVSITRRTPVVPEMQPWIRPLPSGIVANATPEASAAPITTPRTRRRPERAIPDSLPPTPPRIARAYIAHRKDARRSQPPAT